MVVIDGAISLLLMYSTSVLVVAVFGLYFSSGMIQMRQKSKQANQASHPLHAARFLVRVCSDGTKKGTLLYG